MYYYWLMIYKNFTLCFLFLFLFFPIGPYARMNVQQLCEFSKPNPLSAKIESSINTSQKDIPNYPKRHIIVSNNTADTLTIRPSRPHIKIILTDGECFPTKREGNGGDWGTREGIHPLANSVEGGLGTRNLGVEFRNSITVANDKGGTRINDGWHARQDLRGVVGYGVKIDLPISLENQSKKVSTMSDLHLHEITNLLGHRDPSEIALVQSGINPSYV